MEATAKSQVNEDMTFGKAPIQRIFQLAKKTFSRSIGQDGVLRHNSDKDEFAKNMDDLTGLMKTLTAEDVGLDPSASLDVRTPQGVKKREAPVTYIGLHEDRDVTLGIFMINPAGRMPLHNHPQMHGILKVVQGSVEVSCYNRVKTLNIPEDLPEPLKTRLDLLEREIVIPTHGPTTQRIGPESSPLILYPNKDNYHEIRLIGSQPAAFLDVLSPPYNSEVDDVGSLEISGDDRRDCSFFQQLLLDNSEEGDSDISWLLRLRQQPPDYYCDSEQYRGPPLVQN